MSRLAVNRLLAALLLAVILNSHDSAYGVDNKQKIQEESHLLTHLMANYDREVRPVYNASHAVAVRVGITLTQIFDMDEKNQVMTTNIWLDQEWQDQLLTWDPAEFNGITKILVPCDKIWLPDIVLYNSADDYSQTYFRSLAAVEHTGNVFWPPPTKFRSTCPVDVKYFPFDDQTCNLKLSSWMYDGTKLDVLNRTTNIDLENYVPNGEWELLEARLTRTEQYYPCCLEPFPYMTVTVRIRRKTLYYMYNIVFPCMMMSSLTVLVFSLPPDSGEKIALGVTVILAFSVFMLAIAEKMPETSESIPLIGIYLTFVMALTTVSVIMTVTVLNFFYRGPNLTPVPAWAKRYIRSGNSSASTGGEWKKKSATASTADQMSSSTSLFSRPTTGAIRSSWGRWPEKYRLDLLRSHFTKGEGLTNSNILTTTTAAAPAGNNAAATSLREGNNGGLSHSPLAAAAAANDGVAMYANAADGVALFGNTYHILDSELGGQQQEAMAEEEQEEKATLNPSLSSLRREKELGQEELLRVIQLLMDKEEQQDRDNEIRREWRLLAETVDRWLFWGFFFVTTASTMVFLVILPYNKRGKFF